MVAKRQTKKDLPVQLDLWGRPVEPYTPSTELAVVADNFRGHDVRRITVDGETLWVLADVARVLGYRNAANAKKTLKPHHVKGGGAPSRNTPLIETSSGLQSMLLVTLGGINRLVMRSDKPEAEEFQNWVTDEVLISIMKTGSYSVRSKHDPVAKTRRRLKCDHDTAVLRIEATKQTKTTHKEFAKLGAVPNDYKALNNAAYQELLGRTAPELREVLGQKGYETPMDRMSGFVLSELSHAKAMADKIAEYQGVTSIDERIELTRNCARYVKENVFAKLGAPGEFIHGMRNDDQRGRIIDTIQRQLAS